MSFDAHPSYVGGKKIDSEADRTKHRDYVVKEAE